MRGNRKGKSIEGVSYWQSYSDMMAALLLMFVLIMSFTLLQSMKSYQEKIEEGKKSQLELQEKQKLLDEQQEQINKLIGVKSELIEALSDEFETTNMSIEVDQQTGAIAFDSNVLFDYDEFKLIDGAKEFLNEFFPMYFHVLMSDDFRPYISEIIIEGHTDDMGEYLYNLDLSQKRAFAIASYCLDESNSLVESNEMEILQQLMTANGKSDNDLIYYEDGTVDGDSSRRVEFKFRLKDDEMIQEMEKILEK